ncbi:hypothetical protein J8273_3030 [Carpediemonas membranifera]|uniref:Uncharacterized protein n=1 Tax=Carpediemonas membranifera TaxID=201153 RepID=A0A8J6B4E0_9EUKA|nr:hypothetical protein J8273_3030 [Carpediemonas membranifera]|eukprot:KAG9395463.1 hypothetical protein J8273_3030 [Carpediemonas membranifera]
MDELIRAGLSFTPEEDPRAALCVTTALRLSAGAPYMAGLPDPMARSVGGRAEHRCPFGNAHVNAGRDWFCHMMVCYSNTWGLEVTRGRSLVIRHRGIQHAVLELIRRVTPHAKPEVPLDYGYLKPQAAQELIQYLREWKRIVDRGGTPPETMPRGRNVIRRKADILIRDPEAARH